MSRKSKRRIRAAKAATAKPRQPVPDSFQFVGTGGVKVRAAEGGDKLATFAGVLYTGAPMKPEGYVTPLIIDLDGVEVPSQTRPVLRQHDHEKIVGHTTAVRVTAAGIEIEGVFSGQPQHVESVTVPARNGFEWQLSIGGNTPITEWLDAGATATVNGREVTGPMIIGRKTVLGEGSFVPLGADGNTSVAVSASRGKGTMFHKAALKLARQQGVEAAQQYTDAAIDEMSADAAKAALKKCMKAEAEAEAADKKDDADDADDSTPEEKADAKASAEAAAAKSVAAAFDREMKKFQAETRRETQRQSEIRARLIKYGAAVSDCEVEGADGKKARVNLIDHAITHNWTADAAELHALRASRPQGGVVPGGLIFTPGQPVMNEAVLECAVFDALRGSFKLFDSDFYRLGEDGKRRVPLAEEKRVTAELNARYPDQVRQAAHTHFRGRIGLQQLLTTLAAANGYRGPATFNDPGGWGEVAAYLSGSIRADGPSTVNTPATLANVQNKFLLQGYMYTEQAYLDICGIIPVKDLKPTKSVQLFGDFQFRPLNPGGEIQHASVGDNPYANQAGIQARMITLDLQYLINDDLSAFGQVPMMLGRGWGLRVNDLVWSKFLAPGTDEGGSTNFFAATHTIAGQSGNANYQSGAGTTLTSAGLQAAKVLLDKQVDPAGKPLGVDAEILLYPPELDVAATELMNAQFIVMAGLASTAAASKQPNTNIWKGRFKPVMSRYLSNSAYTGYSTTAWYLLANPGVIPVIQIAALNGQMTPMIQTASQDWNFNMLGISMRGWGGIGVSMQNFRGAVQSAGA